MVSSSVYPGLERKPGGPDNWVERAKGLPQYIERIAKHLHYEQGFTISHAIATAVNTVKRWARGGTVTKSGTTKRITAKTQALAARAVAEWEAKRKAGSINLAVMFGEDYESWLDLAEGECTFCDQPATQKIVYANGKAQMEVCDGHIERGKKMAAKATPPGEGPDPENIDSVTDLATLEVRDTQCMVALKLPDGLAEKIAVSGGVPAEDLHVTIGYFGDVDDDAIGSIADGARKVAAATRALKGTVGGLGQFPASDNGVPHFCPVDLPGVNELYVRLVAALAGSTTPVKQDHGFTAHITLAWDQDVEPVPSIPVEFTVLQVVRGDELVEEFTLGAAGSAPKPQGGTIPPTVKRPEEAEVELSALLERARSVSDPEQKGRIRAKILELAFPAEERKVAADKGQTIPGTDSFPIRNEQDLKNAIQAFGRAKDPEAAKRHIISRARALGLGHLVPKQWKVDLAESILQGFIDLAMTKDGRKSFKNQGKWKHGFVPVDDAAVEAKAKGSPIARKRIQRLFSGNAIQNKPANANKPIKSRPKLRIKAEGGGTTSASSAARLGNAEIKDATANQRVNPKVKREVSRGRGNSARALKAWDAIPDEAKVVRNGKRYVVATFAGKQQLTEWVGPNHGPQIKADPADGLFASITLAKAKTFNTGQLRRLLAVPGQPDHVKAILNKALREELAAARKPEGVGV